MSASVMASLVLLKPSPSPLLGRAKLRGVRPSARPSLLIVASKKAKKVQTAQPYGPGGGVVFKEGVDASGRAAKVSLWTWVYFLLLLMLSFVLSLIVDEIFTVVHRLIILQFYQGKGVYQFADKYGANVDGYSPIYTPEEWSPSGDVYVGGKTGLFLWAVTLSGILLGGALLVYNTSALAS
ncbi:photosystem II 10 kDa polypeptide, chloroplastic isoform X1 [Triticum aestivum]|uniref:photosystem II 10 kDa polypeptide, chloroplastic isoform X1 n=1 Tax=Triticum aestivum TaxID=4565 RepID=UPI001D027675|nr:photosystem II 10 kDa polypeptide, chloroplastic-like isoform X1 [Triticum aestivum]